VRGALRYIAARLQIANGTDLTPLQAEIGRRLTTSDRCVVSDMFDPKRRIG
jgi:hypothetical protein